jgi:diacylglycerol O-acyltransferase
MSAETPRPLQFDDRMSDTDALMWNLESDPMLRSTILSTMILDRAPDRTRFERKLDAAIQLIPRLRQRVVADQFGIAPPKWEIDPTFDIRFHLRRARVPAPGTVRDLLDFAAPLAMQGFDKDRPLWELHIVEGLEGGRCAVIMKLHHAISDGVGLVRMTECLIERGPEEDFDATETPTTPATSNEDKTSVWDRVQDALVHRVRESGATALRVGSSIRGNALGTLRHPIETARDVAATLASVGRVLAPASEPLSPVMTGRSAGVHFDYLTIPLADLKSAGKAVGGSVNDAFVAGVTGGLARYHQNFGKAPETLRMLMPINVRTEEKANLAGNQFAPARFEVPVAIDSPAERIREIRRLCREQKDEPALPWFEQISGTLGALPPFMVGSLFGAMQKTTDFTTSNVPGPRRPTYMSGAQIECFMPFGPLAGAAANFTVFSYNGSMHIGINTDPAAVSHPSLLLESLRKSFDEVLTVVE